MKFTNKTIDAIADASEDKRWVAAQVPLEGVKLYQHYLGELFLLTHGCPIRTECNSRKTFVVCTRLSDNAYQIHDYEEFHESVEHEGKTGPRFRFIADPADIMPHGGHP